MKNLFLVYTLTFILCSSVQARSSLFGNFLFGGSSDTTKRSSTLPQNADLFNNNLTNPVYSETEIDPMIINSTFDKEFVDLYSWNVSENIAVGENSSGFEDAATKQSVKKQLVDISSKPPPVTSQPRPTIEHIESQSVKNTVSGEVNVTSSPDDPEEVVLGTTKASIVTEDKTIFQKSLEWVENTYTLSILIPVAAGVLFATTCVITVALCRCVRRCCRRRRLRKKIMLPDSVKSLRASDRKRLLGDCSSDEEF
ncbi:hypothetical protein JTE90_000486 [Oedothorax gibbosus]|uniref:Uncharacterized protein n=1 Tax=Oedothorax gibbosus TaxID=931172 RepID=A0AAV6TYP9_9ARAC|nr:hypothetical protein JTE90_000486 [Oedothorax gibbosus]